MNLVLAVTGATGAYAAYSLIDKSPWPVSLVMTEHGRQVYETEFGPAGELEGRAAAVFSNSDLAAPISSGSVPTAGMVILPCSTNTLGKIASGIAETLVTRAAHNHLKEGSRLVLCVRESPWTAIDFDNARKLACAGATVMPISPPYYMFSGKAPGDVSMRELLDAFADRVLSVLGDHSGENWETIR